MKIRYNSYSRLYCEGCEILLISKEGEVVSAVKEWNDKPEEIHFFGCKS